MQPVAIDHALDWGHHYRILFTYHPDTRGLRGYIHGPIGSVGEVERHLVTLISLQVAGVAGTFKYTGVEAPAFSMIVPRDHAGQFELSIRLGGSDTREGELFGRYRVTPRGVDYAETFHKLTVFETRMLGNERLYRWLPYPRSTLAPCVLKTDLHTHSSGQISAEGLLEVAAKNNVAYPTRLLDILHIPYPDHAVVKTTRFFFPPTDAADPASVPKEEDAVPVSSLSADARERLTVALSIPPDRQMTFGELEITVYRYRTPISKHPAVAYDLLLKTAEEYAQMGVAYAEITATSTSLLLPDYLRLLHEAMPGIEKATGVAVRFLVGLPRNFSPAMLHREVDKIELMGASPYIVGVDFMGFEDNKVGELEPYMQRIADWAKAHDPEFTLRIHAGENRKNLGNVKESLRLAQKFGMRVRIGHAAHGLDDEAIDIAETLAQEKLCVIEFNPDSNLALNNIDTAEELDMAKCLNRDIPFVICSDGAGLYQTDVQQLELAAAFAGVGANRILSVAGHEEAHMAREAARFARKHNALPADFLAQAEAGFAKLAARKLPDAPRAQDRQREFEAHLGQLGIQFSAESIAEATRGKVPILLLGATGERNWQLISLPHRQQIWRALDGLVQKLNAQKCYFLIGRPKDEGITSLLSRAVAERNAHASPEKRMALISATVQADQTTHSFTPGLSHVLPLKGSLFSVPDQLVKYVSQENGVMLCIGGGTFVRDAILVARGEGIAFGLMKGPEGASTDKAVMVNPERQFHDFNSLIAFLQGVNPALLAL